MVLFGPGERRSVYAQMALSDFKKHGDQIVFVPRSEKVKHTRDQVNIPLPKWLFSLIVFYITYIRPILLKRKIKRDKNGKVIGIDFKKDPIQGLWINKEGKLQSIDKFGRRVNALIKKWNQDLNITTHSFRHETITNIFTKKLKNCEDLNHAISVSESLLNATSEVFKKFYNHVDIQEHANALANELLEGRMNDEEIRNTIGRLSEVVEQTIDDHELEDLKNPVISRIIRHILDDREWKKYYRKEKRKLQGYDDINDNEEEEEEKGKPEEEGKTKDDVDDEEEPIKNRLRKRKKINYIEINEEDEHDEEYSEYEEEIENETPDDPIDVEKDMQIINHKIERGKLLFKMISKKGISYLTLKDVNKYEKVIEDYLTRKLNK